MHVPVTSGASNLRHAGSSRWTLDDTADTISSGDTGQQKSAKQVEVLPSAKGGWSGSATPDLGGNGEGVAKTGEPHHAGMPLTFFS